MVQRLSGTSPLNPKFPHVHGLIFANFSTTVSTEISMSPLFANCFTLNKLPRSLITLLAFPSWLIS